MMTRGNIWFRDSGNEYVSRGEPYFFDPKEFEWAQYIIENWREIRTELSPLIDDNKDEFLKSYFEDVLQSAPNNWKTEGLYFWSRANRPVIRMFPKTNEIVKKYLVL
jgi:aspartyl/asparaginyl beta-hydroxylase (cupin superfamily)